MSLRARVLAGMAAIVVVLMVSVTTLTRATEIQLLGQVDEQLRAAGSRGSGVPGPQSANERPGGRSQARSATEPDDRISSMYRAVVYGDGTLEVRQYPNLLDSPLPDLSTTDLLRAAATGQAFTATSTDGSVRYRIAVEQVSPTGNLSVVALPLTDVDRAVERVAQLAMLGAAAVTAMVALVTWWVIRLGVRPVKRMTETATAIAAGDLSHRVVGADPGTEAGQLGVALNTMLERIESSFDERLRTEARLRQFAADASHELRTPITTIRGYAELYRIGALHEPTALDDAMHRTEDEAVRMGALIDDLLHLARTDQGRPLDQHVVDLAVIAADTVQDALAVDPTRPITTAVETEVLVTGDAGRLRQVAANLVGNALAHTEPGTAVEVGLRIDDDTGDAVLEVRDKGPGMTEDVRARAFERFFRADPSRSRHRGGTGLGLAIVEATVLAHGGTVELVSTPGVGTTARVTLPGHPSAKPPDQAVMSTPVASTRDAGWGHR